MADCRKCKHNYKPSTCEPKCNRMCDGESDFEPITNYDRVKGMGIEGLAEFLSLCVSDCKGKELEQKEFCEGCPFDSGVGYCTDKRIKKWLQSEAE